MRSISLGPAEPASSDVIRQRLAKAWDQGYAQALRDAARGALGAEVPANPYDDQDLR